MFAAPYRRQRGNALLIPEEVVGVNRRLHLNQSIEVVLEVHGAENLGLFVTFGAVVGGADVHISDTEYWILNRIPARWGNGVALSGISASFPPSSGTLLRRISGFVVLWSKLAHSRTDWIQVGFFAEEEADGGDSHGFVLLYLFPGDWVDDAGRRDGLEKKADEEVAVHGGYRFLVLQNHIGGILVQQSLHAEICYLFGYSHQFNFVGQNHPKAPAAAAADCPEQILSHGAPVQDSPLGVDDTRVHRVVHGQPVLPEHVPVSSPAKVPADADGGADPAREPVDRALLRYPVVKLAERSPGLYPRRLGRDIHVDGPDIEHIKNNKARLLGDIRKPLVVMAAAADFDLNVGAVGAQNHRRNVGLLQGSYNDDRFRRFRGVEPEIPHIRV
nr:hypothetical protein KK1_050349 [Ipomoea batatas]